MMHPDYHLKLKKNRRELRNQSAGGFTLIELVVAMAIFAVLTLAGWRVFDNLIQVRERTAIKSAQVNDIQSTYQQLIRDFTQTVPRSVTIGNNKESAVLIRENELRLTRGGVIDPLQMGVSPLERVIYAVQQGQLIRQSFNQVDQTGNLVPIKTVMLDDVSEWTVSAIDDTADRASTNTWPVGTEGIIPLSPSAPEVPAFIKLPLAVQITLTTHGQQLKWLLPLVKNLPQGIVSPNPSPNPASGVTPTPPPPNTQPDDNTPPPQQATAQNSGTDAPATGGSRD